MLSIPFLVDTNKLCKRVKSRKSVDFGKAICVHADDLIGENQVMNMSPDRLSAIFKIRKAEVVLLLFAKANHKPCDMEIIGRGWESMNRESSFVSLSFTITIARITMPMVP